MLAALVGPVVAWSCSSVTSARPSSRSCRCALFHDRRRSGAYAARVLYLGAMMGFFFFTTQLMQNVLGFTAFQAGLGFLPMTVVNFAVATVLPKVARRFGDALPLVAGVALTLAGMAWLASVDAASSYLTGVALPMVLIGAGQGLAFAPLTSFGIVGVPRRGRRRRQRPGQHRPPARHGHWSGRSSSPPRPTPPTSPPGCPRPCRGAPGSWLCAWSSSWPSSSRPSAVSGSRPLRR